MHAAGRTTGFYCKSRPILHSPSARLAYLKTPKSASLAIQALFQQQFSDYRWADAHEVLPNGTFTFTFVREPLRRALSAYAEIDVAYALRAPPEKQNAMHTVFQHVSRRDSSKEEPRLLAFLDDLIDHRFGGDDREHWMPTHAYAQVNFLCNHRVDFVGHLENQAADWDAMQALARIPPSQRSQFPHAHDSSVLKANSSNASASVCNRACQLKAQDQHVAQTPQVLQRLCDIYASDFVCLGYLMPPFCIIHAGRNGGTGDHPMLNGTAPVACSSGKSCKSAPVYVMPYLDGHAAWRLAHEPRYQNSLFIVGSSLENRSNLFRLKRAYNKSFTVTTPGVQALLRDFDRYGWYWRATVDNSSAAAAYIRAPLAVGVPTHDASGQALSALTDTVRTAIDHAVSEAQQQLLIHQYDRVVVAGHGLTASAPGGPSAAVAQHILDRLTKRLHEPHSAAALGDSMNGGLPHWRAGDRSSHAPGPAGSRKMNGQRNASTPHKHFLPGR